LKVQQEWLTLNADDGTSLRAFVARPDGRPSRGLLLFQEAFGVNAHIRDVAGRFAAEGFLVISPELFHRTAPAFECAYSDFALAAPHLQAITEQGLDADVRAAYSWISGEGVGGNCAAVGYCLGGRVAFVANSTLPLKAAASYYGGRIPPLLGRAPKLSGPMLFFWGGRDHHIPETDRQAVVSGVRDAGKVFVNVIFSDADHGFFCDARPSYHPAAAAQAWSLTHTFLDVYCPAPR
jgi:carboxymethylenebutenolidase